MSEQEQIEKYLRGKVNHSSPIIEVYGDYIILAQNLTDLQGKKSRIDRGDRLGFYIKQRILDIINSN